MTQHKWHKEIKAWADGAEIERWYWQYDGWGTALNPSWYDHENYRIKAQPKEPQYLYVYGYLENQNISFEKTIGMPYIGKIKLEVDNERMP